MNCDEIQTALVVVKRYLKKNLFLCTCTQYFFVDSKKKVVDDHQDGINLKPNSRTFFR